MSTIQAQIWKPWLNHSTHWFAGWTITVPVAQGALIATGLAVIVGLAGDAAWTNAAFALHQYRARDEPQTGLFRMQQVALRNAGGPIGFAWDIVCIGHAWRKNKDFWTLIRSYELALVPLILEGLFVAGAILVGLVGVAPYKANLVLLEPTNCGFWSPEREPVEGPNKEYYSAAWLTSAKYIAEVERGRQYASQCYHNQDVRLGCTGLTIQQLPYQTFANATCPFDKMCKTGPEGAFRVDTGLINSLQHLGVNSAKADRVDFQIVTTCAPIDIDDYATYAKEQYLNSTVITQQVDIGPVQTRNYTYTYSTFQIPAENGYQLE